MGYSRSAPGRFVGKLAAETLLFVALYAGRGGMVFARDFDVLISEIHYHTPAETGSDDRLEFIELQNLADESVSLAGWLFEDGVAYLFPEHAFIGPRGFCV